MKKIMLLVTLILGMLYANTPLVDISKTTFSIMKGPNRGAAYGTFKNNHSESVFLTGFEAAGFIKPELHNHIEKDGVMQMVKIDTIEIKPGETIELKTGGLHLMFDVAPDMLDRADITMTLHFKTHSGQISSQTQNFTIASHKSCACTS